MVKPTKNKTQQHSDNKAIGPKHVAIAAVLVVALIAALIVAIMIPGILKQQNLDITRATYTESSFVVETQTSDINPDRQYVLYTNYACPYCAALYHENINAQYTTRLLLRDNDDSRFDTQALVCSFMLKLYRANEVTFNELEAWLYEHQDEWTSLDEDDTLSLLNDKSGQDWREEDLSECLAELTEVKQSIPSDLEFVPAIFADGKCYNDYMLEIFGVN